MLGPKNQLARLALRTHRARRSGGASRRVRGLPGGLGDDASPRPSTDGGPMPGSSKGMRRPGARLLALLAGGEPRPEPGGHPRNPILHWDKRTERETNDSCWAVWAWGCPWCWRFCCCGGAARSRCRDGRGWRRKSARAKSLQVQRGHSRFQSCQNLATTRHEDNQRLDTILAGSRLTAWGEQGEHGSPGCIAGGPQLLDYAFISPAGRPGSFIGPREKDVWRQPAWLGTVSSYFRRSDEDSRTGRLLRQADRELGTRQINGKKAPRV